MKYKIKEIGPTATVLDREFSALDLQQMLGEVGVEVAPAGGSQPVKPADTSVAGVAVTVHLKVELTRSELTVFVTGSLQGNIGVTCSRCLGPATIHVNEPQLNVTYLPVAAESGEEKQLTLEDLDTYCHDGEFLDLTPMLREALILSIPIAPLCSPGCRGICSSCGADLNRVACRCAADPQDRPEWAAKLAALKVQKN